MPQNFSNLLNFIPSIPINEQRSPLDHPLLNFFTLFFNPNDPNNPDILPNSLNTFEVSNRNIFINWLRNLMTESNFKF